MAAAGKAPNCGSISMSGWPRGKPYLKRLVGRTSQDVDFEALAWEFFKRHPLPEAQPPK